jgi:peroxiredoxin
MSKIGGTKSNDDLYNFNRSALKIQQKMQDFKTANVDKFTEAQSKSDTVTMNRLIKELNVLNNEIVSLSANFPEKNPKSYLSVLFIDNMFNAPEVDIKKITRNYNNLDTSLKNTKLGKALKTRIDTYVSIEIGNTAPDFSAPNPEGKMVSLKESLGKITIIDFWASWCGPCRKENPNVVALYNEFHAKGLNIIGVSLDKDAGKWTEAIAKDGLAWTHVSNLKFWQDPIAVMYGIKSIPATLILDEKGTIIARDLRGAELRTKIASVLGN